MIFNFNIKKWFLENHSRRDKIMAIENKFWISVIVGAIILLVVSIVLYTTLKEEDVTEDTTSPTKVLDGDKIKIKYTVRVNGCNGEVYDSNNEDIINGSNVERSIFFNELPFWPESFVIGDHPALRSFPDFEKNIKGHEVGDIFDFTLRAQGELEYDENLVEIIPVLETIPLYETLGFENFSKLFNMDMPIPGMIIEHPFWNWDVEIFYVGEGGNVTIQHRPDINANVTALPWPASVVDISSEHDTITLKHDTSNSGIMKTIIEPFDYREYRSSFYNMPRGGHITLMDSEKIIIDFNDVRAGKNICFQIEILEIIE